MIDLEKIEPRIETPKVDDTEKLISEAKKFIESLNLNYDDVKKENLIFVDYSNLEKFSSNLASKLITDPEEMMQILETASDDLISGIYPRVRFKNIPDTYRIRIEDIRAKHLNKLITIEGYLVQVSDVRPQVVVAKFECPDCGTIISVLQIEKIFREPKKCTCGRTERFILKSKEMVDAQRIIVSETTEMEKMEDNMMIPSAGHIAVFIQEDLTNPDKDLIGKLGKKIKVTGVLKEIPVPLSDYEGVSTRFDLAIEANNLFFEEQDDYVIKISEQDEKEILALAKDPEVFDKLAASVAPGIWGYGDIKKAIVLQLFSSARGNINTLIIGDPKTGKSNLLKFINELKPQAEYLDCALMQDKDIASQLRSIPIKRISPDKRFISINDLNTINAYDGEAYGLIKKQILDGASILATARPKFGRFEPFQTIAQQIDLHPNLINNFDLIFIIRDLPDKYKDSAVANAILNDFPTRESIINKELLRKYLVYAKIKTSPKLNSEAIEEIREFYVKLRNPANPRHDGLIQSIPLSARQLDTLAKLAEAHARMRLSNEANREDAKLAISIMKYYMMQVGYDPENKEFDADRFEGCSSSQRKKLGLILNAIQDLEKSLGKFLPIEEVEKVLEDDMTQVELTQLIDKLIASGDVFIPRAGFIQRI